MGRNGRQDVGGLFTALITPFDAKGRVNVDSISKLVKFQISKGSDGIFPCGSTGLGPMLGIDERKEVAQTVIDSAARKVPVVIQVGCADTASTIELAKHAEKAGSTAVASLTPYYYKPGEKAIAKHFEEISASVEIPVFAYNIPQFTGNALTPGAVASLANSGIIDGIKDSSRDFLHLIDLLKAIPDDFVVMNGAEEYALFAIMSGADGLVSGGASALPELFSGLVDAEKKGDSKAALLAQGTVQKVKDLVKQGPIPAYYEILRERGLDCGAPRPPFLPLAKEDSVRIIEDLREMRLI